MNVCMVSESTWFSRSLLILVYLWQLAPGELYRPVALHHDALVLHGSLHHHKVVQQLVLDGGVQPSLPDLLVKARRSWGRPQETGLEMNGLQTGRIRCWISGSFI